MKFKVVYFGTKDYSNELKDFEIVDEDPDFIISIGGDGTLLSSERMYPEIPKIVYQESPTCVMCINLPLSIIKNKLEKNEFRMRTYPKICITVNNKEFIAINDCMIRNKNLVEAIRFNLEINNKVLNKNFIGDGIVVATPYGSHAYFKSVTGKTFENGLGIAFNNCTGRPDPIFLDKEANINFELSRNTAFVGFDNDKENIQEIEEKSHVQISLSNKLMNIVELI